MRCHCPSVPALQDLIGDARQSTRAFGTNWPIVTEPGEIIELGRHRLLCSDSTDVAQGRHADDSAIVTVVRDSETGVLYVVDANMERRKPDRIIDEIIEYQRMRRYACFGRERNQFQQFMSDELKRRSSEAGVYMNASDINQTSDKLGSLQKL